MPIMNDIMNIGENGKDINQEFSPNFFRNDMNLSEENEIQEEQEHEAPKSNLYTDLEKDWMTVINRMFMKGMTADKIINSIGNQIYSLPNSEEILKYINKYEGLIGTIFVDSKVLDQGFPMSMMPKGWDQFHRYSIHCDNPVARKIQRAEGGLSGDIDMFLSSSDKNAIKEEMVCSTSGLPVLKAGMFNEETISGIMESLGRSGNKLSDLQSAMKEIALKISPKAKEQIEFEKADTNFGLGKGKINVQTQEAQPENNPITYNLKSHKEFAKVMQQQVEIANDQSVKTEDGMDIGSIQMQSFKKSSNSDIDIQKQGKKPIENMKMEYKKSSKSDIKMNHIQQKLNGEIKMNDDLRF